MNEIKFETPYDGGTDSPVGDLLPILLSVGSNIIGDFLNSLTTQDINQKNIAYTAEENRILREREDNAVQRRQNDLRLAGINPILAGTDPAQAQLGHGLQLLAPNLQGMYNSADNIISHRIAKETERSNKAKENLEERKVTQEIRESLKRMDFTDKQIEEIEERLFYLDLDKKWQYEEVAKKISNIEADTLLKEKQRITETYLATLTNAKTDTEKKQLEVMSANINKMNAESLKIFKEIEELGVRMGLENKQIEKLNADILMIESEIDLNNFRKTMESMKFTRDTIAEISNQIRDWLLPWKKSTTTTETKNYDRWGDYNGKTTTTTTKE